MYECAWVMYNTRGMQKWITNAVLLNNVSILSCRACWTCPCPNWARQWGAAWGGWGCQWNLYPACYPACPSLACPSLAACPCGLACHPAQGLSYPSGGDSGEPWTRPQLAGPSQWRVIGGWNWGHWRTGTLKGTEKKKKTLGNHNAITNWGEEIPFSLGTARKKEPHWCLASNMNVPFLIFDQACVMDHDIEHWFCFDIYGY